MKLLELFVQPSAQEIITRIHNEFDTASERLLLEADKAIQELDIPLESEIEKKADRLLKVGFINSELIKKVEPIKKKREENKEVVKMLKEEARLLKYYQQTYPFQKFLTEKELDKICNKYNLIYAPIANYKMDVPDENLKHIEQLQSLKVEDKKKNEYSIKFKFYSFDHNDKPKWLLKDIFLGELDNGEESYMSSNMQNFLVAKRFKIDNFIAESTEVKETNKQGLFIAAPINEFDLKGLDKNSKYGWSTILQREIKDPIVFEYCRGGMIRVITKWGLEASDETLVNPINN